MNTDNMTISGETIDYGPCAFIDGYDPAMVFSSIDQHGRYAYGNQPKIAQWNLARLAETLLDLINPDDSDDAVKRASDVVNGFPEATSGPGYRACGPSSGLRAKSRRTWNLPSGCLPCWKRRAPISPVFSAVFQRPRFRARHAAPRSLFDNPAGFDVWLPLWQARLAREDRTDDEKMAAMNGANPVYIPRNHMVEAALESAAKGDLAPFERLVEVLADPFTERKGLEVFALGAPSDFGPYTTFCGT
jgi:uncharacterized protein YdiU (UPF0061 family)